MLEYNCGWSPILPHVNIDQGAAVKDTPFLTDVKTLRQRARQHIEGGA
jgi:hypothetical protein